MVRPWRGVYAIGDDEIARIQALFRRLPPEARLAGSSAAWWFGFAEAQPEQVHILVPQGMHHPQLQGVRVYESVQPVPAEVWVYGVPSLPAARVAVDLARQNRRMDALPILDAALRAGVCSAEELCLETMRHRGLRGVVQVRELVWLADGRSECRQESQLRLIIVDGGLPTPTPQLEVGPFRLDLADETFRVGMEYDGQSHLTRDRLRADRRRMNWLASRGWQMRYFTDADIYRNPEGIVNTLRPLYR